MLEYEGKPCSALALRELDRQGNLALPDLRPRLACRSLAVPR
jgi:hypothetical protein